MNDRICAMIVGKLIGIAFRLSGRLGGVFPAQTPAAHLQLAVEEHEERNNQGDNREGFNETVEQEHTTHQRRGCFGLASDAFDRPSHEETVTDAGANRCTCSRKACAYQSECVWGVEHGFTPFQWDMAVLV